MKKFRFLCFSAFVIATLFATPSEVFSKEISLNQLPAAIEKLHARFPIKINERMFWMECYQESPDSRVEIIIQVNPSNPEESSDEYIEYLETLDRDQLADILGDQVMGFIDSSPVSVRVNLAFTDFNDYRILFSK